MAVKKKSAAKRAISPAAAASKSPRRYFRRHLAPPATAREIAANLGLTVEDLAAGREFLHKLGL